MLPGTMPRHLERHRRPPEQPDGPRPAATASAGAKAWCTPIRRIDAGFLLVAAFLVVFVIYLAAQR